MQEAPEGAEKCPECQTSLQFGRLAALGAENSFMVDRVLSRKTAEEQESQMLRKMEEAGRHLDEIISGQLAYFNPDDLGGVIGSSSREESVSHLGNELATMIEAGIEKLSFEGLHLQDLLSANQNKVQNALKIGCRFLKSKKYVEASEWWALQRGQPESLQSPKAELLFLLMEMFTHRLAGQTKLAELASEQIRRHPEFVVLP
ncbi:MAG: hypothetical protein IPM81_02005 [Saprospirales bacterium]|jgi:hypothetical protein|nr:hypothetical protein [Saprospirales bacterium]